MRKLKRKEKKREEEEQEDEEQEENKNKNKNKNKNNKKSMKNNGNFKFFLFMAQNAPTGARGWGPSAATLHDPSTLSGREGAKAALPRSSCVKPHTHHTEKEK